MTTHSPAYYRDLLQSVQQLHENIDQLPQWFKDCWQQWNVEVSNAGNGYKTFDCKIPVSHWAVANLGIRFQINPGGFVLLQSFRYFNRDWTGFYFEFKDDTDFLQTPRNYELAKICSEICSEYIKIPITDIHLTYDIMDSWQGSKLTPSLNYEVDRAIKDQLHPVAKSIYDHLGD